MHANSTPYIELSVIIVNYNSGHFAADCIQSVLSQRGVAFEIIVIDNASQDNSVALLSNRFAQQIQLIQSEKNLGFAKANNLAAARALGECLLLLNPDTILHDLTTLRVMVDTLLSNPRYGLLAPLINEPRKDKQVLPRYSYPSVHNLRYTQTFNQLPGKIAWVLGACMLLKRDVFNQIKGFDPDYFLYGEDTDICLKLRLANYEIGYCDQVVIEHVGGASELGAETLGKWLRKKRGLYLFLQKHLDARDLNRIATKEIWKSRLYLAGHYLKGIISDNRSAIFADKRHRLQATIIAAQEAIEGKISKQ